MNAWNGYDRWRMGIDDPHLNQPDPCEYCECEGVDEPQDDCDCGCHDQDDGSDWFDESAYEERRRG